MWTIDETTIYLTARSALESSPPAMLDAVREGLARGREVYGGLDVDADARDFRREAGQELRDAIVYVCAEIVRHGDDSGELFGVAERLAEAWVRLGGRV
jgi:hypothetical protein